MLPSDRGKIRSLESGPRKLRYGMVEDWAGLPFLAFSFLGGIGIRQAVLQCFALGRLTAEVLQSARTLCARSLGSCQELQEETARQLLKNSHDLHASDGGPPGLSAESLGEVEEADSNCGRDAGEVQH